MKTEIFTAKTVEEAKALAAKTFNAPVSEITFEVIEEPKKLLGFISTGEAKVRASYEKKEEPAYVPPAVEYDSVEEKAPSPQPPEDAAVEAAAEESDEAAAPAEEPAPAVESTLVAEDDSEEKKAFDPAEEVIQVVETTLSDEAPAAAEASGDKAPLQLDEELITGEPSEAALAKIEKAKAYLQSILKEMGVEAELVVNAGAESAMIDIVAANNGTVIGKRGETLDALQYLTFMIANRGDKEYYRIILNSANYRERRRKTLEELAAKIAKNVLRSGRQTRLEPMNPYERRIIHSAIAEIEGVSSRSEGEEPYRRVVISSLNRQNRRRGGRNDGRNDRGDRNDRGRGRRDNRDRRRSNEVPSERISMDSMKTSFEKDYKRPKADDDINAGLYGKIEF